MKKSLFMLGLAVAAMTSCSNDELMEVNTNNVITFESHVDKGTRAVTNTDALTKFYVFGSYGTTRVFDNVAVTKDGSNWDYTNHVAWTANSYKFAAYATTNASAQITPAYNNATGVLTFSDVVANDASDLVAATTTVDNTGLTNAAVNLTFKHLLSKVQFVLTNSSTENYTMKVSNITFSALKQGDCVFDGAAAWTAEGTAEALSFAGTTENIAQGAAFTSEDHIVIPNQTILDTKNDSDPTNDVNVITASFKVEFYDASVPANKVYEKNYTNVSLALTGGAKWQPGYLYKYTGSIKPTTSYIEFNVISVEDWQSATPSVSL